MAAEGGPFPSRERTIPKGTPLVVDVRATDFGQQLFEARIAPLTDPETARTCAGWRSATAPDGLRGVT